jgi:hypothetical protein
VNIGPTDLINKTVRCRLLSLSEYAVAGLLTSFVALGSNPNTHSRTWCWASRGKLSGYAPANALAAEW